MNILEAKKKKMHITRPLSRALSYSVTRVIKKTSVAVSLVVVLSLGILVSQNMIATPSKVHAVTPPESCFATSGTTSKMITAYYDNEGNNPANPACPRAVDIPATIAGAPVIGIGTYSMSGKNLTAVTFPSTITTLNQYALAYNQIETVTIPPNLTVINTAVFRANKITSIVFHDNVTVIGDRAFVDNDLPSVDIPPNVTTIGPRAFWGNELTEVTISANVTNIASEAFSYNYNLESVVVEGNPTTIGSNVLMGTQVRKVVYNGTVYEPRTTNVTLADSCVSFQTASQTILSYHRYYNLVDVKNGINCLSSDVTIPENINGLPVLSIGSYAFSSRDLTSVALPANLTSIQNGAFDSNYIQAVSIPQSVHTIGQYAFSYNKLTDIAIPNPNATLGAAAFAGNQLTSVVLPANLLVLERGVFRQNYITDIQLPVSLTTIESTALAMNKIKQITIPAGVSVIERSAFMGQNPVGREIDDYYSGASWYSDDASVRLAGYNSLWYVRVLLEDPTNPHDIQSAYINEEEWTYFDVNDDGDMNDSLGGHIVQAVPFTVRYIDGSGNDLRPAEITVGAISGTGDVIGDYLVKNAPTLPGFADVWGPTPEELKAISEAFDAAYYQLGDEVAWTAPNISGYVKTSPASGTFVLGESTVNVLDLGYITQAEYDGRNASVDNPGNLSSTGFNVWLLAMIAICIVATGGAVIKLSQKIG